MDYSSSRERQRAAAASRRAARSEHNNSHNTSYANTNANGHNNNHNGNGNGDTTKLTGNQLHSRIKSKQYTSPSSHQQRQPLEKSFLSSLSRALHTIDQHNNDYFSDNHNHNWNGQNNNGDRMTSETNKNNKHYHKSKSTLKPRPPTNFTSYLHFSKSSIYTLLLFTSLYLLVLYCTFPMVSYSNIDILPTANNNNDDDTSSNTNNRLYNHYHNDVKPGSSFQRIRGHAQYQHLQSQLGTWKDRAMEWEERAKVRAQMEAREIQEEERYLVDSAVEQLSNSGVREDVRKMNQLLEEVVEEFDEEVEKTSKEREESLGNRGSEEHWNMALKSWDEAVGVDTSSDEQQQSSGNGDVNESGNDKRPGFIVLGMHRSGTSMLSGLLVEGFGYETGGPLIMPNFDNEKGFYERIDVVLQNDEFFEAQGIDWTYNVINYDSEAALRDKMLGKINFDEGKRALKFLNNHHKTLPYLQKDPRMCIALPTWLKLLDDEPAVVFTYRHPLEVALSLKKRDSGFTLEHGLRLWIIYNMRAIQNSARLCRVFSTNEKVMKDPTREVQRIKNELTDRCHVMPPVKSLMPQSVVDSFIDPNLQHNSKERKNDEKTSRILKNFGNDCIAKEFESDFEEGSSKYRAEREMFLMAMQVFCDFEIGKAYEDDYEWPDLKHWQRPSSNDN